MTDIAPSRRAAWAERLARLIPPFDEGPVPRPPSTLWAFFAWCLRGSFPVLLAASLVSVLAGTAEVVLLPNDANTLGVASAAASAARDEGWSVAVVPTRSSLQGLAALAVADAERPFADDVAAMAEAAGSTRWTEVTTAVRESATMAGICRPGDVLGLLEGDVVLIGQDVEQVAAGLVDRMLDGGGELVTVVTGQQAPEGAADRLVEHVEDTRNGVEVVTYEGGQPHYPLLLAVE